LGIACKRYYGCFDNKRGKLHGRGRKGGTKKRVALLECMVQRFHSIVALTALTLSEMVAKLVKSMLVLKRSPPEAVTLVVLAVQVGPSKERPVMFKAALVATLLMV
jgi:hypothetical protein